MDETIVGAAGLPLETVRAAPLRVGSPLTMLRNGVALAAGVIESWRILGRFRPDAVFATGGYASVPVGVAARLRRLPLLVYLPDVNPGWAVRLLSRMATRIAATSERSLDALPKSKTVATGYPVREEFWTASKAEAREKLGLPQDEPVLLVTGASQGARRLNDAVADQLEGLLALCYVVHLTGRADEQKALARREALPEAQRERYRVYGYLDDIPSAMAAADLAVMRSGASVLGELPAARLPAVLVPGVYEGGYDQRANARYLAEEGAAVVLENEELGELTNVVARLLSDRQHLQSMGEAARRLARPDAARTIAKMLTEMAAA
jgi:UDP-N-acetylglucosamine--N-acetylmuramyl-(pentapeptide) pyrophosphoryl-undecaprenol N-acetylglucosamine transferase